MDQDSEILRQADQLIGAGRPQEALPRLLALVKADPHSEQGWLLLSYALTEVQQQRDCLKRVLKINPANLEARSRLAQLVGSRAAAPGSSSASADPLERLSQLAGRAPAPQRPAVQRPTPMKHKTAPFTVVDEADLKSLTSAASPQAPPAKAAPPATPPPAPPSPTDWLARLNPDLPQPRHAAIAGVAQAGAHPAGPLPAAQPARPQTSARRFRPLRPVEWVVAGLLVVSMLGCGLAAIYAFQTYQVEQAYVVPSPTPSAIAFPTFPPAWTPTPGGATPTQPLLAALASPVTPTPSPTRAPTEPPTPNSTTRAAMDVIQQQVADLRGLATLRGGDTRSYLISKYRLELTARGLLMNPDYEAELKNLAHVYSALGVIKPTYDLVRLALNSQVDNIGGFYVPGTKQILIVGNKFSGLEHYIFAHEYDHALVDQHFDMNGLGIYPNCQGDAQRCRAVRALVEGDATLLQDLWWRQYASPQDAADIQAYQPPEQALPEQYPPPFALRDSDLSYIVGYAFVKHLYDRGNWAEVDGAYSNLPQSTEQIMHPDKYLAGEAPVEVPAPPLSDALGGDWQELDSNSLGEWMTYMILGYGADVAAQLDDATAAKAAAGWGGDHYQIFYSNTLTATVLAAEWVWDTPADVKEFRAAMQTYLNERFRGSKIEDRTDGDCWEANNQAACLFVKKQATLWLLAPDQTILNAVLAQYSDFH